MNTQLGLVTRVVRGVPGWRRFPPNLFAIPFGLAGLTDAWDAARPVLHTPAAVPDAISVVAALTWAVLLACYLAQGTASALADFRHKVFSPFISLAPITGMLLALTLSSYAFTAGRVLVVVFLVITLLVGGLLTGEWITADLDHDSAHPGYFLPTVAGGLVGSFCAVGVHLHALGAVSFGIGLLSWFLVGSTILNRLFFHSTLPEPLVPTLAIELAPPAVAGIGYFALTGGRTDLLAQGLAGYAILMVLVQIRLLPRFRALKFSPAFWAFTFSWAAAATDALEWIAVRRPPGAAAYATAVLSVITLFIGYVAVRTVILVRRGQLLPPRPLPAAGPAPQPEAVLVPEAGQPGVGPNEDADSAPVRLPAASG
jgi:tellurite resistance protein